MFLDNEAATLKLGHQIALHCPKQQFTIHLEGELGAGKTTLTRGLLRQLGYQGKVKSPTYTLVEHYTVAERSVFHFDLYRVADPEELNYLGLDDYLSHNSLCIIEWASLGQGFLPTPDLVITLRYHDLIREVALMAYSSLAIKMCDALEI